MPSPEPLNPAEFFTAMIHWLVKTVIAGWLGRRQSPRIGLALARIREMEQLFQRLAELLAAGPEALRLLVENHPPPAPATRQAASGIRLAAKAGSERKRYWRVPAPEPRDGGAVPEAANHPGLVPAPTPGPASPPAPPTAPGSLRNQFGLPGCPPKPARQKPAPWHAQIVTI